MSNPKTCRHDVLQVIFGKGFDTISTCGSCSIKVTTDMLEFKVYDQDLATGLWVRNYHPEEALYSGIV